MPCEASHSESAEDSAKSEFDAEHFERVVRRAGQDHVGHPGQALAGDVDDLGVEHVAGQQDLVGGERDGRRLRRRGGVLVQAHPITVGLDYRQGTNALGADLRRMTRRRTRGGPPAASSPMDRSATRPRRRPSKPKTC